MKVWRRIRLAALACALAQAQAVCYAEALAVGEEGIRRGLVENRLTRIVAAAADDAVDRKGQVDVDTANLDFGQPQGGGESVKTGIRFQNIDIPRGSTILSALLIVRARNNSPNDAGPLIQIFAEDVSSSSDFNDRVAFSSKALTNAVTNWQLPIFEAGNIVVSDNFAAVVQEVIDRNDWVPGGAMSFIFQKVAGDGSSEFRLAESFEGAESDIGARPILNIVFEDNIDEGEEDEEDEENEDENEDDDGGNEGDDNEDNENSSVVVVISLLGVVVVLAGGAFLYTPRGKSSNAAGSNVMDPGPPVVAKTLARFGPGKEMFGPDVKAPKKKRTDLTFNRREDAFENKVRARGISV
mmetsp:Transcript_6849/g.12651  ORF Transcript_6849/g.12651 Transcript_6849/m.12651 type:complete len:354 (-) Transcript_6849:218-1279(-)